MSALTKAATRPISRTSISKPTSKDPTLMNDHTTATGKGATRVFSHQLVSRDIRRLTKAMRDFDVPPIHRVTRPSGNTKLCNAISALSTSSLLLIRVHTSIRLRPSLATLASMEQWVSASMRSVSMELRNSSVHNVLSQEHSAQMERRFT